MPDTRCTANSPVVLRARLRTACGLAALGLLAACQAGSHGSIAADPTGAAGADVQIPVQVAIGAVQGTGLRSPLLGRQVTVQGVVTGNFARGLGGVFLQDAGDGDPATSDGLFVQRAMDNDSEHGGSEPVLHAGDRVEVSGTVAELGDNELSTLTELRDAVVRVIGRGEVAPLVLSAAPVDASDWERYEGMRLAISAPLTISDNNRLARYGELVASFAGRLFQPTELAAPGPDAARVAGDNARRTLLLDDNRNSKDPETLWFLPQPLSDAAPVRAGSELRHVTGILDQSRGKYRLQLTSPLDIVQAPRPAAPDVPGDVRVASLNLLNLFNGDGHGGGFPTERGAQTEPQYRMQQRKLVAVVQALRPDIAGLMEVENDGSGPDSTLGQFVAALNAAGPARDYTLVNTGARLGSDAIHVAMIFRSSRVQPRGKPVFLTGGPFENRSRVPMAQAFRAGKGPVFVVEVNHFKSKGCGRDADAASGPEQDQHDGQGCWTPMRVESARRVNAWLGTDPTHSGGKLALLVGDLNAHAMEAPLQLLRDAGWQDAFALAKVSKPYSFTFDGQVGRLDHALLTPALAPRLRGAVEWHNNADEADAFDYHRDTDGDTWRASDHDPILLGLDLRR
ncbi:ExeM/NucH family extracellular endonuclease [soil metagenome]